LDPVARLSGSFRSLLCHFSFVTFTFLHGLFFLRLRFIPATSLFLEAFVSHHLFPEPNQPKKRDYDRPTTFLFLISSTTDLSTTFLIFSIICSGPSLYFFCFIWDCSLIVGTSPLSLLPPRPNSPCRYPPNSSRRFPSSLAIALCKKIFSGFLYSLFFQSIFRSFTFCLVMFIQCIHCSSYPFSLFNVP